MNRTGIAAIALLAIGAFGLWHVFAERPAATHAGPQAEPEHHHPAVTASAAEAGAADRPSDDRAVAGPPQTIPAPPAPATPATAPPRKTLNTEAALLTDSDGNQGLDLRAISERLKGDGFSDFLDRLADEAATSPLALDITELYTQSAAEANAAGGRQLTLRIACGTTVCGISATAPSREVFDAWFGAFVEHPSAPPYGAGRHDKTTASGEVEYRVVFSTDPERQHLIMPTP